jgi:signal transduction histidine kinase
LARALVVHQRQRILAAVVTVMFPVFPTIYFLRTAGWIGDDMAFVGFEAASTVTKSLFSNLCMDAHLEEDGAVDARRPGRDDAAAQEICSAARRSLLRWLFHEVREALNAVTLSTDLIAVGFGGEGVGTAVGNGDGRRQDLQLDRLNASRQIKISSIQIMDTLSSAQTLQCVEDGSFALEERPFSPADVLAQVHAQVEAAARAAGVGVTVSIAAGVPGAVLGDGFVLRAVLVHLVSNAVRFSRRGDTVTIVARASQADEGVGSRVGHPTQERLVIAVTDTGSGFDCSEDVFSPYRVRPRPSSPPAGRGSGLGLPACQALLRRMGGDLQCRSALGQGSVLTALVPLRTPLPAAEGRSAAHPEVRHRIERNGAVQAANVGDLLEFTHEAAPTLPLAPAPRSPRRDTTATNDGAPLNVLIVDGRSFACMADNFTSLR